MDSTWLTPAQLLALFRGAGFPLWQAVAMGAIALRESGGPGATAANPAARNLNPKTGDNSYGLVQINWAVQSVRMTLVAAMPELSTGPEILLNPAKHAEAAYHLWGKNDANLNVAWYINRPNYQAAFESHLPAMMQAALAATA